MNVTAVDVLLVGVGCIILLYWFLTWQFSYWKQRNVKYVAALPFIGSYYDAVTFKKYVGLMVSDFYKEHPNDRVVGYFRGRIPELLVNDLDLIKLVLIKDFKYFQNRGLPGNERKEPLSKHLVLAKGDTWKALRHKLTPTFTSGKIKKLLPFIDECGKELKIYIDKIISEGQEYEIYDLMSKYTTDVIGSCIFGIKMQSMQEENSPFILMGKEIFSVSTLRTLKNALAIFEPRLFFWLGLTVMRKEVELFFINLFTSISEQRKTEAPRDDFVDMLLKLKAKNYSSLRNSSTEEKGHDIELTDELLAAQAFVFFAAGFETPSSLMSYCLHELAFNPDIQDKVVNEILTALNKYGDQMTYEAIKEMNYLDMVISETLRKYPSTGVISRECTQKYTFPDENLTIDKGIYVTVSIHGIHHDPKYYPNPEKFDPERFTSEAISKRHPMAYLPFGAGPRNCIGSKFGKLQSAVGLISILKSYSVTPSSKAKARIEYAAQGIVLSSKSGILINFKHRM